MNIIYLYPLFHRIQYETLRVLCHNVTMEIGYSIKLYLCYGVDVMPLLQEYCLCFGLMYLLDWDFWTDVAFAQVLFVPLLLRFSCFSDH
jgi:hypothetical protein